MKLRANGPNSRRVAEMIKIERFVESELFFSNPLFLGRHGVAGSVLTPIFVEVSQGG